MDLTGRPRTVRATHRYAALLVAVLWAAAPALAVLHAQAEIHRFCGEHGSLEETGGPGPARGLGPASEEQRAGDASDDAGAHEGCAFARHCRFTERLTAFVLAAGAELQWTPLPSPEIGTWLPAVPLIRLAPKTSPPV